jgi:hypothetical protein
MNPPWVTLWNEINAAVGNDGALKVAPLDESGQPYVVRIKARSRKKAVGLASLLKLRHEFGNLTVIAEVSDGQGNPITPVVPQSAEELAALVRSAFIGNGWFRDVVVRDFMGMQVCPVFAKRVIQFFNDDLSDLYSNYNNVASAVFANVLEPSVGDFALLCSTAKR